MRSTCSRIASLAVLLVSCLLLLISLPAVDAAKRGKSSNAAKKDTPIGAPPARLVAARSKDTALVALESVSDYDLIVAPPRNYSVAVLLTAVNSGVNCVPCQKFQPSYENLAKGWSSAANDEDELNSLIFSVVEFKDGKEIFQRLQLTYAPVLMLFPPSVGPKAAEPVKYDFNRLGFEGHDVAEFLGSTLGIDFPYTAPFPWAAAGAGMGGMAFLASLIFYIVPKLAKSQRSVAAMSSAGLKSVIMVISLVTIVIMCSGHMWNGIRQAPYMGMGQGGRPEYFAAGFQNQFGAETHIVAAMYALLGFSFISLTVFVPAQRDPVRQRAGVYVWSVIFLATFSLVFSVFRLKNPSYPFRLFF